MQQNLFTNKKFHFVGIGGIGMSGMAEILSLMGATIVGSDLHENNLTDYLTSLGIKVFIGHDESHVCEETDILVYSNAIRETNPEFLKAKAMGITVIPRAQMLGELARLNRAIAVSGTHGKTTTTAMISDILEKAQLYPTMLVGGILSNLGRNAHLGKGDFFVYEACEAFGSIDYLGGEIIVITNIDNDHMEFYKNMENLLNSFLQFINRVSPKGIAILNGDDKFTEQILSKISVPFILFGFNNENELYATNIENHGFYCVFDVIYQKKLLGHFKMQTPGKHNILNALASLAVALKLGIPVNEMKEALESFTTPERRFQLYGKYHNSYIVDDYAHHPTEIAATIKTALEMKNSVGDIKRVIVAFQPHLYSRTEIHHQSFAKELAKADFIILAPIYEAREKNTNNISLKIITDIFDEDGFSNYSVSHTLSETYDQVKAQIKDDDLVIIMGAGDINEVAQLLTAS